LEEFLQILDIKGTSIPLVPLLIILGVCYG